jgi:hypothetical protein
MDMQVRLSEAPDLRPFADSHADAHCRRSDQYQDDPSLRGIH